MKNILIILSLFITAICFAVFAEEISYYKAAEVISYVIAAICVATGFVWTIKYFFHALAKKL